MDPRKARDPRLSRVDPRLQRVDSGSPAPTSTPPTQQSTLPASQWAENEMSSSQAPSHHVSDDSTNSIQPQQGPPEYKPRPLFCVVCASNQASYPNCNTSSALNNSLQNRSMEGHCVLSWVNVTA